MVENKLMPARIHERRGLVLLLSGPSGVGKDTIIAKLMEKTEKIIHSLSVTTRPPRGKEVHGKDYLFMDRATFEEKIEQGEMLEYDTYCGNYYGTMRKPLIDEIVKGNDVVLDITVTGAHYVMKNLPETVSIFLLPPTFSELKRRLMSRGTESEEQVQYRLKNAYLEVAKASEFDYVLINDNLDLTAERILSILEAEKHRYFRVKGIEDLLLKY